MLAVLLTGCVEDGAVLTTRDGSLPDQGARDFGMRDMAMPAIEGRRTVAAATNHTCAIGADGLYCWGSDSGEQLGNGSAGDSNVPVAVESDADFVSVVALNTHTCALDSMGALFCWGTNDDGQLGLGDRRSRDVPTEVPLPGPVVEVEVGQAHTCVILASGALYCWGRNSEGQLGIEPATVDSTPDPTQVGTETDWVRISAHQGHTCGVRGDDLWCWGRNSSFHLALGPGAPIQVRTPTRASTGPWTELAAGQNHGCGIQADRSLWCWGDNSFFQLASGDRTSRPEPMLSDSGPWEATDTDTFHGCAIQSGVIACWGRGIEGQLGTGDIADREVPAIIAPPPSESWSEVSTGRFHTCARDVLGDVYCTGMNENGQVGTGEDSRERELTLVLRVSPG